jgi:transcriptional regulator with XRE-family HTH domain
VRRPAAIDAETLGERLRAARISHGLSLRQAADLSGLSRTFISQVERGQVSPSVASLNKIAEALSIHLAELFLPATTQTEGLVRATERARMTLRPGEHWDEVLSPSLHGRLLVLQSTILPGAGSGAAYHHPADEECVLVQQGMLEIEVDGQAHVLTPGDTMTYSSRRLHAWKNVGDVDVVAIWIITPPNY